MSVRIKPTSQIKARLGINPSGPVQKKFTNTCARYMDKYIPRQDGLLRNNKVIESTKITYVSPHAHYIFNGKLYVDPITGKGAFYSPEFGFWSRPNTKKVATDIPLNYHTPGTGSHWDKRMWTADGKEVVKEVQSYINGGNR